MIQTNAACAYGIAAAHAFIFKTSRITAENVRTVTVLGEPFYWATCGISIHMTWSQSIVVLPVWYQYF